jgi:hypothetical protein
MKTGMKTVMLMALMSVVAHNQMPAMRSERQQAYAPLKPKNSQKKQRRKARRQS